VRTVLDVLQAYKRPMGYHPEDYMGPADQYPRGFRLSLIGRDGVEHWQVKGRLFRRWVRID